MAIITRDKSVIPACDVETLEHLSKIVRVTVDVDGISAYKIGFDLGYGFGLPRVVERVKNLYPEAVIIFDHQKAGTDVPFTGKKFARRMKESGVDAAIIFPESGPETQKAWTQELLEREIGVLVGGEMTHKGYKRSEGGYIADDALEEMYVNGAKQGVTDFVVPGNRTERICVYKKIIEEMGIKPAFYAPGFIGQGGVISDAAKVAGDKWHAICGRAVYNPNGKDNLDDVTENEMKESVLQLVSQL